RPASARPLRRGRFRKRARQRRGARCGPVGERRLPAAGDSRCQPLLRWSRRAPDRGRGRLAGCQDRIVSPAPAKRSALDAFADEEWAAEGVVGLEVVEARFEGYLNLRLDPADGDLAAAAAEVLGTALVTVPNTVVDGLGVTIYWLGPDEWLLRTPSEDDRGLAGKLEARLGGFWHSLIDVSGGMAHLALAGPAARDVLSQGMTL